MWYSEGSLTDLTLLSMHQLSGRRFRRHSEVVLVRMTHWLLQVMHLSVEVPLALFEQAMLVVFHPVKDGIMERRSHSRSKWPVSPQKLHLSLRGRSGPLFRYRGWY